MRRLADTLSCDASNVTGLVDRLESRGLVQRQASPHDRRVKVLQLTPTGMRLRSQVLQRMAARALPLSKLSIAQQRRLIELLEALVDEESDEARPPARCSSRRCD
jgi:DNA-binding MarR family transcriptional regulator